MKTMRTSLIAVAVLGALMLPAAARGDAASEAELHYSLGLELYKQHRFEEALQHLIASNRLVPNANVVFNIAQTYGLLHRDADAFNWYQTYLEFDAIDAEARDRGTKAAAALAPKLAILAVTSTPRGTELFIDRVELGSVGTAPRRLAVAPGERTVIARLPGHHDAKATLVAVSSQELPVELQLTPIRGVVRVDSVPPGAQVLDEKTGALLGTTPLRLELPLGEVRVTIHAEGYVDQQREASVREEAEANLEVELTAAASRVSVLSVTGTAGAQVRLDGRDLGPVPLVSSGLKPGSFLLEIGSPELESLRRQIVLEPGAATRVDVHLEPPNGGRFRWLHWVGYGAGAVALIAGAIVGGVAISNRNTFYAAPSRPTYDLVGSENTTADALLISGLVVAAATFVLDRLILPPAQTRASVELAR